VDLVIPAKAGIRTSFLFRREKRWYEAYDSVEMAIQKKKQIKKWERGWKLRLIEELNPEWKDLYDDLIEGPGFPPPRE
jgi:putative endonuclease